MADFFTWSKGGKGSCKKCSLRCSPHSGKHLSIPKNKQTTFLLDLALEFVERSEKMVPKHQWWHDYIQAAAGRLFKYDDGDAIPLGRSPEMKRLRKMISGLAPVQEPVLICGPSGAGKEMVARLLHEASQRADGPFIPVNCAILSTSSDLAHDRLFEHRAGAYTGASSDGKGAFEAADDGTLLLDEVGELPLDVPSLKERPEDMKSIANALNHQARIPWYSVNHVLH